MSPPPAYRPCRTHTHAEGGYSLDVSEHTNLSIHSFGNGTRTSSTSNSSYLWDLVQTDDHVETMNDSGSYSVDSTPERTESQVQDSMRRDSVGDYFYEYDYYESINNIDCGGYTSFHHVHETINEDSEHHFTQSFGETRTTDPGAPGHWSGSLTQDDRTVDHATRDWLDEGMLFAIFYDPEGGCQVVSSQPYTNTVHETSDSDWHYHLDATYDELEFHGDWTLDSS